MAANSRANVVCLTVTAWFSLVFFAVTSTLVAVSLRHIGQEFAIGYRLQGALAPARAGALALAAFLSGFVGDRIGKRRLLGGAMFVIAAGLLWIASSGSYAELFAAMMLLGAGLGCMEALISPLVADLHPDAVVTHLNVLHAFYPAGIAVSAIVIGLALSRGIHWQIPFMIAPLPLVVIGIVFLACRYPGSHAAVRSAPLRVRTILSSPIFWLLAVAMTLTAGCEGALLYWGPHFLQSEYGSSALVGGSGLALFGVAMTLGRLGMSRAVRAVPLRRLMVGLSFLAAAVTLGLVLLDSTWASVVLMALTGLCCAAFWPTILAAATQRIAAGSATLLAMLSVAGIVGFGGFPLVIGVIAESASGGLRTALGILPVAFVAAAFVLMAAFGHGKGAHTP